MKLFIPYHNDKTPIRRYELQYCLKQNLANKEISQVFILSEDTIKIRHKKLISLKISHRPTFNDLLNFSKIHEGIKIIANSDIFFTLSKLKDIDYAKRLVILTRWNIPQIGLPEFYGSPASQDTWIFKEAPAIDIDYCLGVKGIDNKIAYETEKVGFDVINPSLSIKSYHYHLSPNKKHFDEVPGPYKFISPCYFRKLPKKPRLLHYSNEKIELHGFIYKHIRDDREMLRNEADIILLQKPANPNILKLIKATKIGWNIQQQYLDCQLEEKEGITLERRMYQLGQIYYPIKPDTPPAPIISPKTPEERVAALRQRIEINNAELQYSGYRHLLSILIPTIEKRSFKFMRLLGALIKQINTNNLGSLVQVLHIKDKGKEEETYTPIGKKRNQLIEMSDGEYVVYIDDDDQIDENYVKLIVETLAKKPDCVTFDGKITFKGAESFKYNFALNYKEYRQVGGVYQRPPGHLTPIKREIAIKYKHKEYSKLKDKGSDVQFAMDMVYAEAIKTSEHINKELYHYLCDPANKDH